MLHLRGWTNPGSSYDEAALFYAGRPGWRRLDWVALSQELVRLADRGLIDQSHQVLIDRLGIGQSVIRWMEFANAAQPRQFASLAKAIVEAEDQVSLSADIVSEGLMALIDLIEDFPKHLPIALVGGLSEVYSPRIQSLGYRVVESQGDALDGLAYIDQHRPQLTIDYWESYA